MDAHHRLDEREIEPAEVVSDGTAALIERSSQIKVGNLDRFIA